jgi:hypothetical protein
MASRISMGNDAYSLCMRCPSNLKKHVKSSFIHKFAEKHYKN